MGIGAVGVAALATKKGVAELRLAQIWQLSQLFRGMCKGTIAPTGAFPTGMKHAPCGFVDPEGVSIMTSSNEGIAAHNA